MASWITHLRVAENLISQIEGLESSLFAIGNIAPDSGIPDEKWEKFNPPPEVTHFRVYETTGYLCGDLDFFRRHLLSFRPDGLERGSFSFRLGYFFHLLTDNLWFKDVYVPTQTRFRAQFEADPDFIWEVKKDWYGLDQRFVRENPDSLYWRVFLDCGYDRGDLDFIPAEAVRQRIQYIQDYYRSDSAEVREMLARPFVYLSQSEMDAFVDRTAARLLRIYQRLWLEGAALPPGLSALDAMP